MLEYFGEMVFGDAVMKSRLPKEIYSALKETVRMGKPLDSQVAGVIASVMKDWAIEKGATHYTHWFQPLTGVTAEKHDGFLSPAKGGAAIMEFSGKELIMGEPDASSFPSGGLRATFEARGYTAWDPNGSAFIKDSTLYIPTLFCSYSGDALDKKTPLLRSMELIDRASRHMLRLFGKEPKRVITTVGAEQEYFLIRKEDYDKRKDLIYCGRTLFGAMPPKGQELSDHYCGSISASARDFMRELDENLWRLGVYAKTEHKEAAPCQYELAPVFTACNTATDHNQLMMELMKKIALRHGLVCVLHEKPFARMNGSGKHNNWSLADETGANIFEPGREPEKNTPFLLFICAMVKAVDDYQDLLRASVAGASNDCRLGGHEAPPAIVSMHLGDGLTAILNAIEKGLPADSAEQGVVEYGVKAVPRLPMDNTDRNRTSPLAFTGNKFEFRMPGSSASIADADIVLNTIAADAMFSFYDELKDAEDVEKAARALMSRELKAHNRILFSGNSYSEAWTAEAMRRGLLNLPTTADALPRLIESKNIELLTRYNIMSEREIRSRYEVQTDNYCSVVLSEARTMVDMVMKQIIPAVKRYEEDVLDVMAKRSSLGLTVLSGDTELANKLSMLADKAYGRAMMLSAKIERAEDIACGRERSCYIRDEVLAGMGDLRDTADALECITAVDRWPFPTYGDMLFRE